MIERLQMKEISELYSIIKNHIETVRISFVAESGTQPLNQGK